MVVETFVIVEDFGFTLEEVEAIKNHFSFSLDYDDWESIIIEEDDQVEEGYNYFRLPTGRIVYFPDELLHKDILAQID